tara:strand:- start:459 stop:689 length:231 start_codon:yes stop_codon:yes gene_type:complete
MVVAFGFRWTTGYLDIQKMALTGWIQSSTPSSLVGLTQSFARRVYYPINQVELGGMDLSATYQHRLPTGGINLNPK